MITCIRALDKQGKVAKRIAARMLCTVAWPVTCVALTPAAPMDTDHPQSPVLEATRRWPGIFST